MLANDTFGAKIPIKIGLIIILFSMVCWSAEAGSEEHYQRGLAAEEKKNCSAAIKSYESAGQNHAAALYRLAWIYGGHFCPQRVLGNNAYNRSLEKYSKNLLERSAHLYSKMAINEKNIEAYHQVGFIYDSDNLLNTFLGGNKVTNNKEAVAWYSKAAESGYVPSQYRLGKKYEDGEGVIRDYEKAFYWFGKAARQGHQEAQLSLSFMYSSGRGVVQDYYNAYVWSLLGGGGPALERHLSTRDITSAQRQANACKQNSYLNCTPFSVWRYLTR